MTSSRLPLRIRLVGVVVLLSALALTVSGFAATTALRRYLLGRVDHPGPGVPPALHRFRLAEAQATLNRLVLIEIIGGAAILVVLGFVAYAVVRRSLYPLAVVESTAEAIAAGDLSRRVPTADLRTEVGSLSHSFNAMLTQIESAFEARATSEAEARASEERMRRFVGDASHELRTPLTSIRGFAELYRQGALPDVERAMSRIESEAKRMGLLVEDLLLLGRLDQQRPLECEAVDLAALVSGSVCSARALEPDRPIALTIDGSPVVVGDEARLTQVVTNLLSNALTHTPAGTPVAVQIAASGTEALVVVADSGPGIPAGARGHVFERFFRTDTSRTRASGGSGLGLSIVASLVAAHGGSVSISDTPGGGSTFTVRLPAGSSGAAPIWPVAPCNTAPRVEPQHC